MPPAWPKPPPDDLGLRHALSPRLLPVLAAAMVFLAALAGAAALAADTLAGHWRAAPSRAGTVQVPQPDQPPIPASPAPALPVLAPSATTRAAAAAAILGAAARRLTDAELAAALRPWLGPDALSLSVALPAVFALSDPVPAALQARLDQAVPGTLVMQNDAWQIRLAALATSLQRCTALALAAVAAIAAATVAIATRAGLDARRETLAIVHGLGATDATIAARFAARIARLILMGAVPGGLAALPVLLWLARLAAPFTSATLSDTPTTLPGITHLASLPPALWLLLAILPPAAASIGWLTAQLSVRAWLARLP